MEITGTAQRTAWLARQTPPVEQLRADLWSIPVPIPNNPLRYVSAYALAVPGGLTLIDTGWDDDDAWAALTAGLRSFGADVADVKGVLVTHLHVDHLGLASRVRAASGAWVAMHPADAEAVAAMSTQDLDDFRDRQVDSLVGLGADRAEAVGDVGDPAEMTVLHRLAVPDRLLRHGELADVPGWALRAVHTPGHTAGHLCFSEERTGLFFSGDHVLPRITPNISTHSVDDGDPLGAYLASLAAVRDHPNTEVLPAHEWRFTGLAMRVDELLLHHEHRLEELMAAVTAAPGSTAWQLAGALTWSRPWDQYERRMRIMAVTETDAHLQQLATRGHIVPASTPGSGGVPVVTWTASGGPGR